MATPVNPLDKFVDYIYHFELHCSHNWDDLKDLDKIVDDGGGKTTDRFAPNGTLLINTRKDAHQHIDDVKFYSQADSTSKTEILVPYGDVTMVISEPGGFSFLEKLEEARKRNKLSLIGEGMIFALKILFVGRYADNSIKTLTAKLIPMVLIPSSTTATFDPAGGKYVMGFQTAPSLAATTTVRAGPAANYSFVKRNVSFYAGTVEEAFKTLETKLNEGYQAQEEYEAIKSGGKRLEYKITFDPELRGKLDGLGKQSLAPGAKVNFSFNPSKQITTYLYDILRHCPEIQAKIGASKELLRKEFHPGIFIPVVIPTVTLYSDRVELHWHVAVNKGTVKRKFEFEYYFSDPGKNVDVLSYEIKFTNVGAWVPVAIKSGFDERINQSSLVQTQKTHIYVHDVVTPDSIRERNLIDRERSQTGFQGNDPRVQAIATNNDRNGYNSQVFHMTAASRAAADTFADFTSALAPQQSCEIRGHLDLLNGVTSYPDGSYEGDFFGDGNIWIKLNVYMPDASIPVGKRQFFYTGYYKLLAVENIFSGGKFTQNLTMVMSPEVGK